VKQGFAGLEKVWARMFSQTTSWQNHNCTIDGQANSYGLHQTNSYRLTGRDDKDSTLFLTMSSGYQLLFERRLADTRISRGEHVEAIDAIEKCLDFLIQQKIRQYVAADADDNERGRSTWHSISKRVRLCRKESMSRRLVASKNI
jgi:hypothetical protein